MKDVMIGGDPDISSQVIYHREPSVPQFSEKLKSKVEVKPDPEDDDDDEEEEEESGPGSSRVTRSMSRIRFDESAEADLKDANQEVQDMVEALRINRELARKERSERPAPVKKEKPKKPSGKAPKIETDDFGWAIDQTIMIRPTFKFWYRPMHERKRFGRSVGFPRSVRSCTMDTVTWNILRIRELQNLQPHELHSLAFKEVEQLETMNSKQLPATVTANRITRMLLPTPEPESR
ncbi:hypothetical protein BJV77DRAFT_968450 [Russula vinacea]|nr:hypothetical protein BJV77DRAFT_968450 [Russula vinacea]